MERSFFFFLVNLIQLSYKENTQSKNLSLKSQSNEEFDKSSLAFSNN